jgi:RNA polymerase sigma-70 factor (ECF subfamily)
VPEAELAELMARYCGGDAEAFRVLYAAVAGRLLAYAKTLVGDRATAEDVLQRTFLKLHSARATYVLGADPLPWLYTITHRLCLDELRSRKRARKVFEPEREEAPVEARATLEGLPENAAEGEANPLGALTLAALDKLSDSYREVLVLTKLHGRTHAEAAAILGTTPGAVKLRAHRAYEKLRQLLPAKPSE